MSHGPYLTRGHTPAGTPFTDNVAFTSDLKSTRALAAEHRDGLSTTAGTTPAADFALLLAGTRSEWRSYLRAAWDAVVAG